MSLNASRQEKLIGINPTAQSLFYQKFEEKNAFDLIWPRMTRRRGHGVIPSSIGRELDSGANRYVAAQFEPPRRSLFAPDWVGLRSVAAAALKAR